MFTESSFYAPVNESLQPIVAPPIIRKSAYRAESGFRYIDETVTVVAIIIAQGRTEIR
jgi:hypothetical protein